MKVLICSDSHGRLDYFQQVIDLEQPEIVIFGGDHSTDAIDMSLVYRDVLFAIVKGNTDMDDYESRETKIFDLMGKKVLLTHGHLYNVKTTLEELEKKVQEERNKKLLYEFKDLDDFNLEKVINFVHQLKEDIKREEKEKTKKI